MRLQSSSGEDFIGMQRLLTFGNGPGSPWDLQGDTRLNQQPVPGGNMAWTYTQVARTTLSAAVVSGTTTSVAVAACPNPALSAGTVSDRVQIGPDNHGVVLNALLGTLNTCVGTTLTLQAAANISAANGDTIQFLEWHPAAQIANDAAGTSWTLGNYLTLTPVALASLLTPCTPGTMAVINNGPTSPVYYANATGTGSSIVPVVCVTGNIWKNH